MVTDAELIRFGVLARRGELGVDSIERLLDEVDRLKCKVARLNNKLVRIADAVKETMEGGDQ